VSRVFVLFLLSISVFISEAQAETRYVSDNLIITLRSGQGTQHQVIKTITSGERLQVLQDLPEAGYTQVKLNDGTEGWVRTQYIVDKPVAKLLLERLEKRYEKLKETSAGSIDELKALKAEFAKLSQEYNKLSKEHKEVTDRMSRINEVAAKPILLDKENRELKEQNVTLTNEMQLVSQENQILKDRSDRDWFIAGSGVIFAGILIGLLLPKLRPSKKNSWSGGSL